jgi:hypothetical protein
MSDAMRPDDSSQALEDAIRVERMALDAGPNADRNLGALARGDPPDSARRDEDREPAVTRPPRQGASRQSDPLPSLEASKPGERGSRSTR